MRFPRMAACSRPATSTARCVCGRPTGGGILGSPLAPGRGFVLWVEFAPDGRTLATSSDTGRVELFDVESREPIGPPLSGVDDQWVTGRFTPDGDHLLALYTNGRAMRWTVDPASWARQACAITGGGLTREQWDAVVPEEDYRQVCPSE